MLVIKIRTFRPLANKGPTPPPPPVRSEFHQSADHSNDGDPRQRGACISRPTGCIPRDPREDRESSSESWSSPSLSFSLRRREISLSASGNPSTGQKKTRKKREKETTAGVASRAVSSGGVWVEIKILMVRFRPADGTIG